MSSGQQQLWIINQLEPESTAYNVTEAFELRGPLDSGALSRAIDMLIARHENLRTAFAWSDDGPVQRLEAAVPGHLDIIDMAGETTSDALAGYEKLIRGIAEDRYDLSAGPLLRAALIYLGDCRWRLIIGLHHILYDAWSSEIFYSDLSALYDAAVLGAEPNLPELPIQYVDYAVWEHERIAKGRYQRQVEFWKGKLADAQTVLRLPNAATRRSVMSCDPHIIKFEPSADVVRALRELSANLQVSLFMTVLAVFQVTLARASGQTDLLVGIPVSGRNRKEVSQLIGFFADYLPIRLELAGDPSFADVVRQAKRSVLDALANQELPLDQIIAVARPERVAGMNPLIQAFFKLFEGDYYNPVPAFHGIEADPLPVPPFQHRLDVGIEAFSNGSQLTGRLLSRADVLDASVTGTLASMSLGLMSAVARNPDERVLALKLD